MQQVRFDARAMLDLFSLENVALRFQCVLTVILGPRGL